MRAGFLPLLLAGGFSGCSAAVGADAEQNSALADAGCQQTYLPLAGRVVDNANILPPDIEDRLTQKLAVLEQATKHQLVIATTGSLQGKRIEDYSLCLARHWGIGDKDANDGVVLLVAPAERRVRIEVGYGLEAQLRDEESARIMDEDMVPAFKAGDYPRGIEAGADAIANEIR